jgi:predicted glycogen debranching enzyme
VILSLPRTAIASTPAALEHEWLVTNGLGGFASGSVALANTRRYHGLLVASLRPPVERVLMVAKLDARVAYRDRKFDLTTNEFADGTLAGQGLAHLAAFHLDGTIPVWTYAIEDALLEQRIWMPKGRNTTYVSYTLRSATQPLEIELAPLCTYRDYHAHTQGGWSLDVSPERQGCRILAFSGARPYRLLIDRGSFTLDSDWYWRFHHRAEAERGLDAQEDLFRPGHFQARLASGETITVAATAEAGAIEPSRTALIQETRRQQTLLADVPADAPSWIRRLTLAADQFLVQRWSDGKPAGTTVVAGYPWFSDWGRDTMIALPGLALATGRLEDAASILRTFAAHVSQGMLPNRFPDQGEAPEYNTVDATLWYFHAIDAYLGATSDRQLLRDLYPVLCDIVDWHRRGTRYGIQEDPVDGLLRAGETGVQLTWMDAKVGDWVVTPRIGKPVEINALWHFALTSLGKWARLLGDARNAADYERAAARVAASFADAFWYAEGEYLYDVIDGVNRDASLRPNQIFAVSLGTDLLSPERARAVVEACSRHLLTPVGLRSLAPGDLRYAARYGGGPRERDGVYHQGTVWAWLLGPFVLAHHRVYGDAKLANDLLSGLAAHLSEACLGSISEIFDADPPHAPRGCCAQAWSVSETLRAWHALAQSTARASHARIARGITP